MQSLLSRLALPWASSQRNTSAKQNESWNTNGASSQGSMNFGPTLSAHGHGKLLPAIANQPETRRLVITASLNKLFTERHFSICTLDAILDCMQGTRHTEAHRLLRTLHCVDYASMSSELRNSIPLLVNEALQPPEVVCAATETALQGVVI